MKGGVMIVLAILLTACQTLSTTKRSHEPIVLPEYAHFLVEDVIGLLSRIDSRKVTVYRMQGEGSPPLEKLLSQKLRLSGYAVSTSTGTSLHCRLSEIGEGQFLMVLNIGEDQSSRLFAINDERIVAKSGWSYKAGITYE